MKSRAEVREMESALVAAGVGEGELLERAGFAIACEIRSQFPRPGSLVACVGKGHNGGDALVAARILQIWGWQIDIVSPYPVPKWAPLCRKILAGMDHEEMNGPLRHFSDHLPADLILDGLLGIGGRAGLQGSYAEFSVAMARRRSRGARVVAMDVPSGLDADTGEAGERTVIADLTLAVGCAKPGLVADGAANYVGRLAVVPVKGLGEDEGSDGVMGRGTLRNLLPPRPYEFHKGMAGRVGIVAGSRGLTGAARLCAEAALRAGAGLVTLFAREDVYPLLAVACPPEVMVRPVASWDDIDPGGFDAMAVGPGLGDEHREEFENLLRRIECPVVLDADGLNRIAANPAAWLRRELIATPHPGEMRRIFPDADGLTRAETARAWCERHEATLLLKGARTLVAERGKPLSYNGTGGPGMGSGGQGDVLTGIIAALVAQGLPPYDAARAGAWMAGNAADSLVFSRERNELTLLASDLLTRLGI